MKFLLGCFFSAFLVCFYLNVHAQVTPATIKGKVLTDSKLPAEGATIILLKYKDSSIVTSAAADKAGIYLFADVAPDNYLLLVSKTGSEKFYSAICRVAAGQTFTVPDISLKTIIKQLNEVQVVSARPQIVASPGKLTINVQNSSLGQGNTALDILRQSPGVRVDNGNDISIIGRQNALILVDDKPTNLTGEDLAGYLRGIPSNTIDRIELLTGGSAKYDAAAGGIINIILKKGKNTGFNGSVTGSAGLGTYFKGNTGFVFNDRTDKYNIFGNYNFADNKNYHTISTDRTIDFDNSVNNYYSDYHSVVVDQVHTFGLGTDFYLSPRHTLGFIVSGLFIDDDFVKHNTLQLYKQGLLDTDIVANSALTRNISRVNYNVNYKGKLDDAGKTLSANYDYTTYTRSSSEYITNIFYDPFGNQEGQPLLLQNLSPSSIRSWLGRIDFSDPLSKTSKFDAGLKATNATSNNDLIYGPLVNGVYTTYPNSSDHFIYSETVNAAYVNYQNKFNKLDMTVALRAEQTITKGTSAADGEVVNRNYVDLFPNLLFSYKLSDKSDLSLSFNRAINRPKYEDINPFIYYFDVYDFRAGNPKLMPEYSTNIEISYSRNSAFIATLYNNIITQAYQFRYFTQNDTTGVDINVPKNFGRIYNYGLRVTTPVTFTSWWNANFNLDASYQRYVAYPVNGNLDKGTQDIIVSGTQYFTISKTLTADLTGFYETPSFYGISQFKANYYVNASFIKKIMDNRGSLKLSFADIFNTVRDRFSTNYQNLNLTSVDKTESQIVKLTFTYRFGKISLKSISHDTGNGEEQDRLYKNNPRGN